MKLLSVNVSRPKEVSYQGRTVRTGIFKQPVASRVLLRTLNLDGDEQGDLSVHGGRNKAVYAYPVEHYAYWEAKLNRRPLPWGMFGENFTTEGLREEEVCIGDRFRVGTAELVVTTPRIPCYKLGIKFGRADLPKQFLASLRTGFYLRVGREGEVGPGDPIELLERDDVSLTVAEVARLYASKKEEGEALERAVALEALPAAWRDHFRKKLQTKKR